MQSFEFVGRIIQVCEMRSGIAKSTGNKWASQEYVIEESGNVQYPKRMCFNVFGEDKIKEMGIEAGMEMKVSFDINAREFGGKWYNDVRAWKVEKVSGPDGNAPGTVAGTGGPTAEPSGTVVGTDGNASGTVAGPVDFGEEGGNGLPF